ncbi:MAG: 2-hydroxyacyl-CoA dehydratase [Deltaproteobacteria bacterium]|jgi:benzoyl-CoA reductase/2-hydroxyglutaryl-CoA dehydratase subunit BcrC/BadD/HgdB|nr:2-hydroxyacyl-CoA dehydratase [Deltaproteobacteria bacterium]MBW2535490.1 2-hydroxyacyl-CoA dehydratase [Deltaproteobacteria bacterium]
MMLEYFQNLAQQLEQRLDAGSDPYVARKTLALEIARFGTRLYSGEHSVAWTGVLAPFDLLHAMGVTSCFVEFIGAMLSSSGGVVPMLEASELAGFSTDGCSYHRSVEGAATQGLMPEPDFLIGTTAPCTGGLAAIENLATHFDKDLFVIHVPQPDVPGAVDYLARQLEEMAAFVTAHTGQPLDSERLAAAIEQTNRTRAALVEMNELASHVPTPARRRDLVNLGIVMALFLGTETGTRIAETYRDEFRRKIEEGDAGVPGERVRLMWLQNRIQFKHPLELMLAEAHHAAVVIDEFNDVPWEPIDPADPFTSLARRTLSNGLCGGVERRITTLQRLARDYRAHGAINPCHWGCRQGTGARGLVEEGLREVGIPVLNLELDCVDPRNFGEGQLRTRLQAFIEMLDERV